VAKAAERIKQAGQVYANPSGTAGAGAALGQAASLGGGTMALALGHPTVGASAIGAVLGTQIMGRMGAWAMTNPKATAWLAESTRLRPDQLQAHLQRLAVMANSTHDPQLQQFSAALTGEIGAQQ
jgi:hypothetical protein